VPAVVFNAGKGAVTVRQLCEIFARFDAQDDVFSHTFAQCSVLLAQSRGPQEPTATLPEALQDLRRSQSNKLLFSTDTGYRPEGPQEPTATVPETLQDFLRTRSIKLFFSTDADYLPEGPYFLRGRSLHQAWRLYADESRSFVTSLTPADDDDDNDGKYK
jgi:hypothetical protein